MPQIQLTPAERKVFRADAHHLDPVVMIGGDGLSAAVIKETEAALRASGVPFVLLRNGWYAENYAGTAPTAVQHGAVLGSAREGRIAAAARADYAAAAAAVLTGADQGGRIYELAGDTAFTLAEFAAAIAQHSGKPVAYVDMPQADYAAALVKVGLPEGFAALLADSDAGAALGGLFDDGKQLSQLIGRSTTPIASAARMRIEMSTKIFEVIIRS